MLIPPVTRTASGSIIHIDESDPLKGMYTYCKHGYFRWVFIFDILANGQQLKNARLKSRKKCPYKRKMQIAKFSSRKYFYFYNARFQRWLLFPPSCFFMQILGQDFFVGSYVFLIRKVLIRKLFFVKAKKSPTNSKCMQRPG